MPGAAIRLWTYFNIHFVGMLHIDRVSQDNVRFSERGFFCFFFLTSFLISQNIYFIKTVVTAVSLGRRLHKHLDAVVTKVTEAWLRSREEVGKEVCVTHQRRWVVTRMVQSWGQAFQNRRSHRVKWICLRSGKGHRRKGQTWGLGLGRMVGLLIRGSCCKCDWLDWRQS